MLNRHIGILLYMFSQCFYFKMFAWKVIFFFIKTPRKVAKTQFWLIQFGMKCCLVLFHFDEQQ